MADEIFNKLFETPMYCAKCGSSKTTWQWGKDGNMKVRCLVLGCSYETPYPEVEDSSIRRKAI